MDVDDLTREIEDKLGGYVEGGVGVDFDEDGQMATIVYVGAGSDVVCTLAERGVLAPGHLWGEAAAALVGRHPDAPWEACVECRQDEEGWYAAIRSVRLTQDGPTDAGLLAAADLVATFLGRGPGGEAFSLDCSVLWFENRVDAHASDWRGKTRAELAIAHELPIPQDDRPGRA